MSTDLTTRPPRTPTVYTKSLDRAIVDALETSQRLRGIQRERYGYLRTPENALPARNDWLPLFAQADAARLTLFNALWTRLGRVTAIEMVTKLYASLGVAKDSRREMAKAVVEMFENDDIVRATARAWDDRDDPLCGWQPVRATPTTVALACRMLVATHKFEPRPAEVRAAVQEASRRIEHAHARASEFCDMFIAVDAILLQHARADWHAPYAKQYRPVLDRVLELHLIEHDDDSPLAQLVRAEQRKLVLPKPEGAAIAACVKPAAKKTKRQRRRTKQPPE